MPKRELSSREDYIIESFADMKKVHTIASKLFEIYFVDTDPTYELSSMMQRMVPQFFIDPYSPEYPGRYVIAGKSSLSYLERIMYILPKVNAKGKYEFDLSAWKGVVINPYEFTQKIKGLRKSKLEPLVIMQDNTGGSHRPQSLVLKEGHTRMKDELIIPFLNIPNVNDYQPEDFGRLIDGVYNPFYRFLPMYLKRNNLDFYRIPPDTIEELKDEMTCTVTMPDGDFVGITKNLIPTLKLSNEYFLANVPNADVPEGSGKRHYILKEVIPDANGHPTYTLYTLMCTLSVL